MQIGILGTGQVGQTLAQGAARAGHSVRFGSRRPGAARDLGYPTVAHTEAIVEADLVISAVAAADSVTNATTIGPEVFAGKVVLDLGNAVTPDFSLIYPNASLGAVLQKTLPRANVVKSLNTLPAPLMINPAAVPDSSVFVSGDDAKAKQIVSGFLQDLGWPAHAIIDLGGIETARGPEHYFLMFITLMQAPGGPHRPFNLAVIPGAED